MIGYAMQIPSAIFLLYKRMKENRQVEWREEKNMGGRESLKGQAKKQYFFRKLKDNFVS